MNRAFRGIWIPAEIWLCNDLTMQEKIFLVEIDSLDNDEGCTASNKYFADFFEISKRRVTAIIQSLAEKGYIKSQVIRDENTNQIMKRVLNISSPPYPRKVMQGIEQNDYTPIEQNDYTPIEQNDYTPIEEKFAVNNTGYNNTGNNNIKDNTKVLSKSTSNFEKFYSVYPRKTNRAKAQQAFMKLNPNEELLQTMIQALAKQFRNLKKSELQFVPHPSTWINGRRWEDEPVNEDSESSSWCEMLEGE